MTTPTWITFNSSSLNPAGLRPRNKRNIAGKRNGFSSLCVQDRERVAELVKELAKLQYENEELCRNQGIYIQ